MARNAKLYWGLFLALAAVACERQEAEVADTLGGFETITASAPDSKTVFSQFTEDDQVYYRVLWENGDKIGLFTGASGQNSAEYTTGVSSPSAVATFTHTNDKNASAVDGYYFAVSPYQTSASFGWGSATTEEKKNCHVILPYAQTAVNGGAPREACIMAARSTGTDFTFQHVFSYIRFVVGEDFPNLTAVRVTNRNGKKMADRMNIYYQSDDITVAFNELKSAVKSWCELKPAAPATVFAPGVYYIAVWPRVYEDGLAFSFVGTQNDTIKREITSQVRLNAAGSVANVGTVRAEDGASSFIPPAQNPSISVNAPEAAMLKLTNVRASAYLTTVKVSSPSTLLSGKIYRNTATGKYRVAKGLNEVVYNTSAMTGAVKEFSIAVCPGTYAQLDLTFTTSLHQVIRRTLTNVTLTAGQETSIDIGKLVPETDILYYEAFDGCVWGGNYAGGAGAASYAPAAEAPGTYATADLSGYELAAATVPYNQAGTGYFQTNKTSVIGNQTVRECHLTSDTYLKSRNFWDYVSLYRGQEFQGCLGLSVTDGYYFKFQTAPFTNITALCNADLSFDLMPGATFDADLVLQLLNGGWLTGAEANGVALAVNNDNHDYLSNYDQYILSKSVLTPGEWTHITLHYSHLSDATSFCLTTGEDHSLKTYGCFLDNFCLTRTADLSQKPSNTLRVLYWNIQYGMWAEQGSNYNNFVNWIKKVNPDVCVFCEGKTVYTDDATGDNPWSTNPYLPDNWSTLAARYNHSYVSVHEAQVVTSNRGITVRGSIPGWKTGGGPVNAGASLVRISAGNKLWYFLPVHLWPQSYSKAVRDASDEAKAASAEAHEGNLDRRDEMQTILNQLYLSEATNLFILGDFNAQSRDDIWYYTGIKHYGWVEQDPGRFLVYDVLTAASPVLYDVVYKKFNGTNLGKKQGRFFFTSNSGTIRKDMVWANSGGYNKVVDVYHAMDSYVNPVSNPNPPRTDLEWTPSDHRPIIFDVSLN